MKIFFVFFGLFVLATNGNELYAVGDNFHCQLGLGKDDRGQYTTQTKVEGLGLSTIVSVSAGLYHSAVVGDESNGTSGVLYTVGQNDLGQLGIGSDRNSDVLFSENPGRGCEWRKVLWDISPPPTIVAVSCSWDSTFALTRDGNLWGFGSNQYGQLGISDMFHVKLEAAGSQKQYRGSPCLVSSLSKHFVSKVSTGGYHVAVISDTGLVFVWGHNAYGQLGLGDFTQRNVPNLLGHLSSENTIHISCGGYHTLAINDLGVAYAFGSNERGQLGTGDLLDIKIPIVIPQLATMNIVYMAAGAFHSLAITEGGQILAWGANDFGQLGLGDTLDRLVPTLLPQQTWSTAWCWASQRSSYLITANGQMLAWGNNDFGMLALGDKTQRLIPATVLRMEGKNAFMIAAGAYHSLALTGCWNLVEPCSGHGECLPSGDCLCSGGYKGSECTLVCPGGLGNECNGHGQCSLINTQLVCTCNGSFAGVACDKTCPTIDRQVCSNQGTCSATGECLCNTGWSGLACNLPCPGETSNPCSSQGLCLNGMCSCFEGYTGANCSIECTGGSQNPCSRNGRCLMDGSCVCFPGFRGPDCSLECPGGHDNVCSMQGECTETNVCQCREGFRGRNCSISCPGSLSAFLDGYPVLIRQCSGHGECGPDGTCQCKSARSGLDCASSSRDLTLYIIIGSAFAFAGLLAFSIYQIVRFRRRVWLEKEKKKKTKRRLRAGRKSRTSKSSEKDKGERKKTKGKSLR